MKDDRLRQPGEPEYLLEIGTAVWVFSILEWNAAWCCEKLKPNCLPKVAERTAGGIAKELIKLPEQLTATAEREALLVNAKVFHELVEVRKTVNVICKLASLPRRRHR